MKRETIFRILSFCVTFLCGAAWTTASGQEAETSRKGDGGTGIEGVTTQSATVRRDGSNVLVDMNLDLTALKVKSTEAVLLTPYLVHGDDSLALPAVGVYGRQRYYYYLRKDKDRMISGEDETTITSGSKADVIPYHATVSYVDWMNDSRLVLGRRDYSCCERLLEDQCSEILSRVLWVPDVPRLIYVSPKGEKTKTRSLSGTAYIDFPVNKTGIYPEYHDNVAEFGKIRSTIDSVRNDRDITVTSIRLKGFASPEGSYAHNTYLARERTATIRRYVLDLYNFDPAIVTVDHEPENWEGLIEWLRTSGLPDAEKILAAAMDTSLEPDAREWRMKKNYPKDYAVMLSEIYPRLRCTKYKIEYDIRNYTDPSEILKVMKAQPQKISLGEFFLAAESLETGSPEFNHVFEVAAVMYPDDPVANLNAANAAMERGDLVTAEERLKKAGAGGEADYARGVLAVMAKEYSTAVEHFMSAEEKGVAEAAEQAMIFKEYAGYTSGSETGGTRE